MIEAGKVSHIGACNLAPDQLREALDASERQGLPRYEWVQNQYNLLNRADERELFGICTDSASRPSRRWPGAYSPARGST
jgi:aryl-alcohol dehydrogenase-like predicted oxidoreductase